MRRVLRSGDGRHEFDESGRSRSSGRRLVFVDVRAATTWLARFLADPSDATCLRGLAGELARGAPLHDDRDVLARIAAALVQGRLALVRAEQPPTVMNVVPERTHERRDVAEDFERPLDSARDEHWIEIQLLDEEGNGMPGQRCRIVTSDERVYNGYTDSLGVARWTRIAPGMCRVCFPDLDGDAWQRVRSEGPAAAGE